MKEKLKLKGNLTLNPEDSRLKKAVESAGLIYDHPSLKYFGTILCDVEDANGNDVRLSRSGIDKALGYLKGTQWNPQHDRSIAYAHTIHAEITDNDQIWIAGAFFADIFPREYEQALDLQSKGKLAVSFEISADVDTMEHLSDGTRRVNDFMFLGTGLLYGIKPACSSAYVTDVAYLNKKDPELMFAKKMINAQDEEMPRTFLITTTEDKHFHISEIDDFGNGETIETMGTDDAEHTHRIVNWQIQEADGHAHRILDAIMAKVKERIESRKYKDSNDPKHKKNSSLENKKTEDKNSQEEHKSMNEEQKKLVAELRQELGDFAKEVKDEELLDEAKVKELRETKEKAETEKEEKSELEKAQEKITELEAQNEELKSTLEAKDSEIEEVRKNAETIAKRKIEFKENEYTKEFSDEDFLDEKKLEEAKIKRENDELKAENEKLKKESEEKAEKEEKKEEKVVEKANLETGAESEESEVNVSDFVTARVKEYKKRNK